MFVQHAAGRGRSVHPELHGSWIGLGLVGMVLMMGSSGCDEPLWGSGYPLATFVSDAVLEVGELATFDASHSRDEGLIEQYTFSFGDGTPTLVTSSPFATHIYQEAGTFTVEVEAIDDLGNIAFERRKVQVFQPGDPDRPQCAGSCAGHLICLAGTCRFTPAECRTGDAAYGCGSGLVCCNGYCEPTCP